MSPLRSGGRAPRILIGCGESVTPEHARELSLAMLGVDPLVAVAGPELLTLAEQHRPNLILTVIDIAELDGIEVVRRLRARGDTVPLLVLTRRSGRTDLINAFTAGADDYVVGPFDPTELQLRIRALLRRSGWVREPDQPAAGRDGSEPTAAADGVRVGDIVLDPATRTVTRGGVPVEVTPTEYALLEFLMAHPRQVLSRQQILEAVWGPYQTGREAVDTYIRYLRRKLDPLGPPSIHTRRGYGYLFDPDRERTGESG